jgi:hypothetical protein
VSDNGKNEDVKKVKRILCFNLCISLFLFVNISSYVYGDQDKQMVFVNQTRLDEKEIQTLEALYNVRLQSGYFWYDAVSGLWGLDGGPTMGQILPGLKLGGPLRADASKSNTGVFINGREIHELEFLYLQRVFGTVNPGRYWLNAQGIGGYEGGPPQFNLNIKAQRIGNDWIKRTPGGTIGGSGGCMYYSHPNGSSVMTGSCN